VLIDASKIMSKTSTAKIRPTEPLIIFHTFYQTSYVHDRKTTMRARTRKTKKIDLMTQEQDQVPPVRILTKSRTKETTIRNRRNDWQLGMKINLKEKGLLQPGLLCTPRKTNSGHKNRNSDSGAHGSEQWQKARCDARHTSD
jgi:hypothetical protein